MNGLPGLFRMALTFDDHGRNTIRNNTDPQGWIGFASFDKGRGKSEDCNRGMPAGRQRSQATLSAPCPISIKSAVDFRAGFPTLRLSPDPQML